MESSTPTDNAASGPEPAGPLYKKALETGVILALAGIAFFVLLYVLGVEYTAKWWVGILIFVIMITLDVLLALRMKKKSGMQVITYWQAFFAVVIMMAVGTVLSSGFQTLMTRVIDPDYQENMKNAVIKNTVEFMENMGVPQEEIDKTIDDMIKGFDEQRDLTPAAVLKGIFFSLIWFAVFGFIMAIFVRKKPPLFDPNLPKA
ncbi:MAG: DUF4199 domain-containing protein [Bacteroidota bacterium]